MNLCVNARDAMPKGGKLTLEAQNLEIGQAEAELHSLVKPGPYVVLSVTDTGHGIPPETLPRIFDPFFTTKGVGKGTGLGLSTVLGIAKSHGGSVTVYSEPDRGTVFKVYIPATGDSAEVASAGSFAPMPLGHGELILVVDDEAAIRDTTGRVLRQHGYRALTASNGGEAITLFVQHTGSVRAVLTDVMMPGMGGLELIRALRILDPDLKIIATSGMERDDQRSEFAGLGVTEILPKPCSPAAVLKAVDRMLAAKR
jgi:CheY-like chemotaxis protein